MARLGRGARRSCSAVYMRILQLYVAAGSMRRRVAVCNATIIYLQLLCWELWVWLLLLVLHAVHCINMCGAMWYHVMLYIHVHAHVDEAIMVPQYTRTETERATTPY